MSEEQESGEEGADKDRSTKEVLSEGELDALMDSYSGDEGAADGGSPSGECKPFDFSTREQTLLAQMPALKKLNELHSSALAEGIQESYGFAVQVAVADIQLLKLDQALTNISDPSAINLAKISPLNGTSYIVLPGALLSYFVDTYFGGAPAGASVAFTRTALTPTELRINEVLIANFLSTLTQAWSEKIDLSPQLTGYESKPTYLQASSPDELALLFPFEIRVGEWTSSIDWIVPYAALEPLRQKLGSLSVESKPQQKNHDWEEHFLRELQHVRLDVSGSFESGLVSISDVLNLKAGSILPLKMPSDVTFCVEKIPFFYGEHGVLNGNKSIKIKEIISHDEESV